MAIGSENVPDSSIHETPVISPLPFWEKKPAATGSAAPAGPRGRMAGTPGRGEGRVPARPPGHVGEGFPVAGRPAERNAQGPGPRLAQRRRRVRAGQVL